MENIIMFNGEFFKNPLEGFTTKPKNNYAEESNANNKIVLSKLGRNSFDFSNLKWKWLKQNEVDYLISLLDIIPTEMKVFLDELNPIVAPVHIKSITLTPKLWIDGGFWYEDVTPEVVDLRW